MRKIHVVVLDTFGTREEAALFRSEATSRLRSEHPETIVQVDLAGSLRESVVPHAYGFGTDDKSRAEEAAGRSVAEVLGVPTMDPSFAAGSREPPSSDASDPPSPARVKKCAKTHCSDGA